jgi:hypothetical protein
MSTAKREDKSFPWIFKDCDERTGYSEDRILYQAAFLSSGQSKISRRAKKLVKKKRELFPGLIPMSPSSLMLPSFTGPSRKDSVETHILVPEY